MASKRKPREPFPYVLRADREKPAAEQPRYIVQPPPNRRWVAICDGSPGQDGALFEAVACCVDRLENDPDAAVFGKADTEERRLFLDELDIQVIRELGTVVAATMLSEPERKN